MRTKLAFFVILLLLGCADKRSEIVIDHLEDSYDKKLNLSFSIKGITNLETIYAGDSLPILKVEYDQKKEKFIREYNELMMASQSLKSNQSQRSQINKEMNGEDINSIPADTLEANQFAWINELERRAMKGNAAAMVYKQKQLVELRKIAGLIVRYKADPDAMLVRTARVTYGIKDDSSDEERVVTKTFVFSADNIRILSVMR